MLFLGFSKATADAVEANRDGAIILFPLRDGVADLSYLRKALESVRKGLHRDLLVVVKSIIPPSTTVNFVKLLFDGVWIKNGRRLPLSSHTGRDCRVELLTDF